MKNHWILWSLALLPMLALSSCSKHWKGMDSTFETNCWNATDTLRLEFENTDTAQVYQLGFPIVLNEDYPFHNIYLRAILQSPSGDKSLIPSEFILADRTGAWLSEPDGEVIPFVLNVPDGLRFNQVGKYSVRLFHFMRDTDLCGVEQAGIAIDPIGEE